MVTAETTHKYVVAAGEIAPDDYPVKPFTAGNLESRRQRHFERQDALAPLLKRFGAMDLAGGIAECDRLIAAQLSQKLIAFLTLVRAEDGGLTVQQQDHNPEDFIRDLAAELVLPPGAPPVTVTIAGAVASCWFYDAYFVRMSIESAVQNAARFARSIITISARMRDGFLVFLVEDDGPGLGAKGAPSTGLGTGSCARPLCRRTATARAPA